jgi:hypothetical protein
MAKHLNADLTSLSLEDHQAQYYTATTSDRKHIEVNVGFDELKKKFKIHSFKEVTLLVDAFAEVDQKYVPPCNSMQFPHLFTAKMA